jgi:hypothetical protein
LVAAPLDVVALALQPIAQFEQAANGKRIALSRYGSRSATEFGVLTKLRRERHRLVNLS